MNRICNKNINSNNTSKISVENSNENIKHMFLTCKKSNIGFINETTEMIDKLYCGSECIHDNTIENESSVFVNYNKLNQLDYKRTQFDNDIESNGRINTLHYLELNEKDLAEADKLIQNRDLKWADWSYLKGPIYDWLPGLHDGMIKLRDKYKHVFAKEQFSRRDLNWPEVTLGLKSKYLKKVLKLIKNNTHYHVISN